MGLEKRKREGDDEHDAGNKMTNKKKTTEPEDDDEEVEEFFAILMRIRAALKHFERSDGSGRSLSAKAWEPSFQADDFGGDDGDHSAGVNAKGLTADSSGLDLNSKPAPSRCNNSRSFE